MPRLIVIRGVDEGKQFDVSGSAVTVGRHSSNSIALHDTQVSRKHLELRPLDTGGFSVFDLGSGNGTLLNGQPVSSSPLRSGDQISLGQSVLLYTAGRADTPANELTERVKLLGRGADSDVLSAIVSRVGVDAGSQILSQPHQGSDWLKSRLAGLSLIHI